MIRRTAVVVLAAGCITGCVEGVAAPPASAIDVCSIAGAVSGLLGKACKVVSGPVGKVIGKLFGGGGSSGGGGGGSTVSAKAGLVAAGVWAFVGARFALKETSKVLGETTGPQLGSTWFSATYWRMTAISALLTLPFLCAAAIQALMRSDLAMLLRAAFGYLPLAALAIAIAAPVTMLLLAGSDEMSKLIASSTGSASTHALRGAGLISGFASLASGSPFFVFVVSGLTIAGALALWLELIIREAAVYVIVLMLPLAFAAMVWPARRVWAIRAVELLVALILSKFAIVAVLTLGGAALNRLGHFGIGAAIGGIALLMLAAFAPWALLRLLPLSELASGAMAGLRRESYPADTMKKIGSLAGVDDDSEPPVEVPATGVYDQAVDAPSPPPRRAGAGEDSREGPEAPRRAVGPGASNSPQAGADGDPPAVGGPPPVGGSPPTGGPPSTGGPAPTGSPLPADGPPPTDAPTSANGAARLPGLDPLWQAGDGEHRTLTLGAGDDGTPVYPLDPPAEQPPAGEDHDPLPERQPPDETG